MDAGRQDWYNLSHTEWDECMSTLREMVNAQYLITDPEEKVFSIPPIGMFSNRDLSNHPMHKNLEK